MLHQVCITLAWLSLLLSLSPPWLPTRPGHGCLSVSVCQPPFLHSNRKNSFQRLMLKTLPPSLSSTPVLVSATLYATLLCMSRCMDRRHSSGF
ncbi:hypothetical protein P170DRAFT_437801 [Aspergillus steynii IBT 23096]|uniref:Secreted protein n=1 Tax=Aspergillus steynii IBT 23096 TaxID=1392250 RepID=A0A2I2G5D5_9EURO|nr:uncharacterized protein P170DRAFT_437801 [Aspergillus steynii IBT 23096]PLB48089.1 hypothetical protein P170DRAFT_437801 [Aspergillus steynii IBT 23096]